VLRLIIAQNLGRTPQFLQHMFPETSLSFVAPQFEQVHGVIFVDLCFVISGQAEVRVWWMSLKSFVVGCVCGSAVCRIRDLSMNVI
jgi:hypothetical protein